MSKKLLTTVALTTACFAGSVVAQAEPIITALPPLDTPELGYDAVAAAELGWMLFFDTRLSGDSSTSCASCHAPEAGWSDGSELSRGYPGTLHWRNSQTLVNAAYLGNSLHWDGTVPGLEAQVPAAMSGSVVANIDPIIAEERLRQIPEYVARFEAIWDSEPTMEYISAAIAAYEMTLVSNDSPFDLFSQGEPSTFNQSALRGLGVFAGKANCIACHNGPLATDLEFYNTGVPANVAFSEEPLLQITFRTMMREYGVPRDMYETFDRDPGLYLATLDTNDLGKMRTPPLRYLTHTAPYMHNGVFYTLEEVVDYYNQGGGEDKFGTKSDLIQPLGLTAAEKIDLVAFLESLSGSEVTAEYPPLPDYGVGAFPANSGAVKVAMDIRLESEPVAQPVVRAATPAPAPVTSSSNGGQVMTIMLDTASDEAKPELSIFPTAQSAPIAAPASIIVENGKRFVIVKDTDTLGTLATEIYGDVLAYQKIYEANQALIPDPNALAVGTKLFIPE